MATLHIRILRTIYSVVQDVTSSCSKGLAEYCICRADQASNGRQGELSKNILQNLLKCLAARTVV